MSTTLTAIQRARERAIQFAIVLDVCLMAACLIVAVVAASLTMAAELVRGALMTVIEVFALLVLRRIHRGRTAAFEFGSGKLEQLVNLLIAAGLLGAAAWILVDAVRLLLRGQATGSPAGFALAATAAGLNVYLNVLAWDGVRRAARGSGSLIMQGQLEARLVKLISSACVQVALTVAALAHDGVVIAWADGLGAVFVGGFIVHSAIGMVKTGLPDLIDRSVAEEFQAAINRMLVRHFSDYERLDHVRTRRAGDTVYAEVALAFDARLTMGEVDARIEAMKATLREEAGPVDISILAASC
jgi:cation diffusion facilitator family transporter